MPSIQSLHLLRHLARRAHEDAITRKDEDSQLLATAHEEVCELLGKTDLLLLLCHLSQDESRNGTQMRDLDVIGAMVGVPHPVVFDLKAAASTGMQPESASNSSSVAERS